MVNPIYSVNSQKIDSYIDLLTNVANSMENWFGHSYVLITKKTKNNHTTHIIQETNKKNKSSMKELVENVNNIMIHTNNLQAERLLTAFEKITNNYAKKHSGIRGFFNHLFSSSTEKTAIKQTKNKIEEIKNYLLLKKVPLDDEEYSSITTLKSEHIELLNKELEEDLWSIGIDGFDFDKDLWEKMNDGTARWIEEDYFKKHPK